MPDIDTSALARELLLSWESGAPVSTPPSARSADFNVAAAYTVEAEIARLRSISGRKAVGLKVGYANKAMWRVLKLDTLVWAHMYDDTVQFASGAAAELALPYYRSPKIEPEVVFELESPIEAPTGDAAAALQSVGRIAIGFEIIDCPYPDWKFQPADFIAAAGLHRALVIGPTMPVEAERIAALIEDLARCKVRVSRNGEFVEEGSGKNSLRSPALCLAELARATHLSAGDLISSGTLTAGHPIAKGETWTVEVDGLPVPGLSVTLA